MTVAESGIGNCPACGSTEINFSLSDSNGICDGCGLVYEGDDWAYDIAEDVQIDSSEEPKSNQDQDWPASITIQDASEKQLVELLNIVVDIGSALQITEDIQLRAGEIVVDAWQSNLTMGRKFEAIAAGAVYAANRKAGRARPSSAVASAASIDAQQLQNAYRVLTHELPINIEPPEPGDYLHYLADQVGLSSKVEPVVHDALSDHQFIGGNPAGIAAASLYLYATEDQSSGTSLTLRVAAEAAGVTKETVWRKSQKLREDSFIDSLREAS